MRPNKNGIDTNMQSLGAKSTKSMPSRRKPQQEGHIELPTKPEVPEKQKSSKFFKNRKNKESIYTDDSRYPTNRALMKEDSDTDEFNDRGQKP